METLSKWTGEDFDMEAEFDVLDEKKEGQIVFEDIVKWALKKNMQVELLKQEEKEKEKEKDKDMGKNEKTEEEKEE